MWTKDQVKRFWQENEAELAGETNSREIVRLCRKYIKGRVLDVGAGSGALVRQIPGAIGLDLVVREGSGVIQGDIVDLRFPDESFDTIFACETLEHLNDDDLRTGLTEMRRCLRKGGHFIATMPNNEDLKQCLVTCPECGTKFHRRLHLQSFDKSSLGRLLEESGFRVVRMSVEPLGFMSLHRWAKHLRFWIVRAGLLSDLNLIAIARRD